MDEGNDVHCLYYIALRSILQETLAQGKIKTIAFFEHTQETRTQKHTPRLDDDAFDMHQQTIATHLSSKVITTLFIFAHIIFLEGVNPCKYHSHDQTE